MTSKITKMQPAKRRKKITCMPINQKAPVVSLGRMRRRGVEGQLRQVDVTAAIVLRHPNGDGDLMEQGLCATPVAYVSDFVIYKK